MPTTWLLAPKRSCRQNMPPDWVLTLRDIPGVRIDSELNGRVTLQAGPDALDAIKRLYGACLHIENLVERRTLK